MAPCLRFYDETKKELREDFIGFAECQTTTREALAEAFLGNLRAVNVEIAKLRGQGYDGVANMSGIHRGVQARIRAEIPGWRSTCIARRTTSTSPLYTCQRRYMGGI